MSGSFGGLSSCSTPLGIEAGDEQRSRKHKVRYTMQQHLLPSPSSFDALHTEGSLLITL